MADGCLQKNAMIYNQHIISPYKNKNNQSCGVCTQLASDCLLPAGCGTCPTISTLWTTS